MRERDIARHFKRRVQENGGEVRRVTWTGRRHAPDQVALMPRWHFLVELKRPGGKARAGQVREHTRLRAAGFTVIVLDSIEIIDDFFSHMRAR